MDPIPSTWSVLEPPPEPSPPEPGAATTVRVRVLAAVGAAVVAAVVVAATVLSANAGAADRTVVLPSADSASASDPPADLIVVEVVGAVRKPGLVRLPADSRVADAIAAAGGYSPGVDAEAAAATLRLAKALADGDQVRVPARGEATASAVAPGGPGGPGGSGGSTAGPVDLNRATESELDALPGIGPVTAGKIIAARTERAFASVDDLRDRKLVGSATFAKIHDLVVVR